jgi:HD-GYP domain-containing protein (c-di-GMP phosphodiesterase class II)
MLVLAAVYMVVLVVCFSIAAESPVWRESLSVIRFMVFSGIFMMTFLIGSYFLRLIDKQIMSQEDMIHELEHKSRIEEQANEEIIHINQMVNEQVVKLTRLSEELEMSYINTVNSLARALDSRDRYTHGHSERVTLWSLKIAERIGYTTDEIARLRQSALLHDMGKIGVRDAILRKNGPLMPDELLEMQQHPVNGYEYIKDVKHLTPCLDGILYHHERIDGRGYPRGLKGHNIPLDARIIGVADTFDAMTSDRPYRKGMPKEKALLIMREVSATQLDPDLVNVFLDLVRDPKEAVYFERSEVSSFD